MSLSFRFSLLLVFMALITSCRLNGTKPTADIKCEERILAEDSKLGKIRNYACERQSLSLTIHEYVQGLEALDFEACPAAFVTAFARHRRAWEAMIPVTDKHSELRGEMHDLFDQIALSADSTEYKTKLKAIWDTWAEVEAAVN